MKIIYFSATSHTEKVVKFLGKQFDDENQEIIDLSRIDLSHYDIKKEELCIIGVPSYGGRIPNIVVERFKHIQAHQTPIILVVTYGNRNYDDAIVELKDMVEEQGFQPIAAMAIVCEHSIVNHFAKGRPNQKDYEELVCFSKKIKQNLNNHLSQVPGKRPYKPYHVVPIQMEVTSQCNGCGLCARKCPKQAIDIKNPHIVDEKKCLSCMRCVSICPRHARKCSQEKLEALKEKLEPVCSIDKKNELFM